MNKSLYSEKYFVLLFIKVHLVVLACSPPRITTYSFNVFYLIILLVRFNIIVFTFTYDPSGADVCTAYDYF